MQRYERTRALIEGDPMLAQKIAAQIEKACQVEVLDEPHEELVMIKVRESARNSLFFLGEALICTCRVRLADTMGHGMVLGKRRNLAYNLALIDAAFSSDQEWQQKAEWEGMLEDAARRQGEREAEEQRRVGKTRVDFSTMEVEG